MANTAQARKRARQSEERRQHNAGLRSRMRTAIKKVRKAIQSGDKTVAQGAFREAQSEIDSISRKGVFHANTASRVKSRLSTAVKAMG